MRPLRLWLLVLCCGSARATVPRLCPDRAASDYVLENFPDSQNPSVEAFSKLSPAQQKAVCAKAAFLAKRPGLVARTSLPHADLGRKIAAALPKPAVDGSALFDHGKVAVSEPLIKTPALPVADAALAIISNENSTREAWRLTAGARSNWWGDKEESQAKLRDLVGAIKVGSEHPGKDDSRLRDIEHYIVAFDEVQGMARPASTDGVVLKTGKTVVREVAALVFETPRVLGYSGIKWLSQTFTKPTEDADYNNPNTSKASWSEVWYGLRGAWSGAYRADYGADRDKDVWGPHTND